MSVHVSSSVWRLLLAPTDKLVMLALADISNDRGESWPSNRLLSDRTGLCERAIQGSLARLEKAGRLTRDMRTGRSTVYRITTETPAADAPPQQMHPAPRAPHPRTTCTPPPHLVHPTPAADAPITINEPSRNRQGNQKKAAPVSVGRPDGVDAGHWRDWLAVRGAKKSPLPSETAMAGMQREANKAGVTLDDAVRVCVERSWVAFNAGWFRGSDRTSAADRRDAETADFLGALTGGLAGTKRPTPTTIEAEDADIRRIA